MYFYNIKPYTNLISVILYLTQFIAHTFWSLIANYNNVMLDEKRRNRMEFTNPKKIVISIPLYKLIN